MPNNTWTTDPFLSSHRLDVAGGAMAVGSSSASRYATAPHTHDCDMLFIPLAGRFEVEQEMIDALQTGPGYYLWIPAEYAHATHAFTSTQKHLAVYVEPDFWKFALKANEVRHLDVGQRRASRALSHYAAKLAFSFGTGDGAAVNAYCGALVHEAARLGATASLPSCPLGADELAAVFADHIQSRLSEPLDVEAFACRQRLSRRQLERLFRQHVGMSPLAYQKQKRLERAMRLLTESNDTVLAVAQQVGWNSGSYLSRVFAETYRMKPEEVRKRSRMKRS